MKKLIVLSLFIFGMLIHTLWATEMPSGETILKKIDENYESKSRISTATMIIKGRRGTRTVKSKSWAEGNDKAFTEYLAPAREKGTKMLKLKDELWTWTPSTDRTIRIAGHMLRQAVLGSDVSYEDFMEDPELSNSYNVKVVGEEKVDERDCYVLELVAKVEEIAYHSRKLWVDKERYLPLKEDRFAKSGKLLKTVKIDDVFQVGTRWYPKKMTFKDVLKKGDGTQFTIDSIEFDADVPKHKFSKASLRR